MGKSFYLLSVFLCFVILPACNSNTENIDGDLDSEVQDAEETELDGDLEAEVDIDGDIEEDFEQESPLVYNWPKCAQLQTNKTLAEKAAYFDKVAKERHIAPDGLIRNIYLNDDLESVKHYYHVPSTMLWTGMYLASQAFRYAVTKDETILDTARLLLEGLHQNMKVTGHKGLYGRSHSRPDVTYGNDTTNNWDWADSPAEGYEGWRFNFDVSKDSYDGLFFGYAIAWQLFDDAQIKSDIANRLQELMDEFVGNGLQIKDYINDPAGVVTEHGRLMATAGDDWPGFNALLASSWVKTSQVALDDQGLDDFYYGCLMGMREDVDCPEIDDPTMMQLLKIESYVDAMEQPLFELFTPDCDQNYDSFDMCYQAIYPLITFEKDPQLKARFIDVMKNKLFHTDDPQYQSIATYGNAYFTFSYAGLSGDDPEEDQVLSDAVDLAICVLKEFPEEKFKRYIPKGEQEVACTNRLDKPTSAERIPLAEYDFDNYLWRLDFFEIVQNEIPEDKQMVYSPEDFLIAYWMARYHNIISEDM